VAACNYRASAGDSAVGRALINLRLDAVDAIELLPHMPALSSPIAPEPFGTDGTNALDDKEIALAQRALTATLSRIGITLSFPWRDFATFKTHWLRDGGPGLPAARSALLSGSL